MFKRIIVVALSLLLTAGALGGSIAFPATASDTVISTSEEALLTIEAASEKQHPYLLYESDEISSLQEKIESGNSKKAFEVIVDTVSSCMGRTFDVTKNANGVIGRQLQYCVMYLSTFAMLTEEESYAYKAVEQVITCVNQGDVDTYLAINDALCIGDFGYAYALAYDTLYNYMTEDERALVKAEMEEIGAWLYENSPSINTWGSQEENRKAWNWNAVTHGALGMISMSLGDHPDWLSLAMERAKGYYRYSVDSTGAGMEGLHYLGYALNTLAPMDYAIYRLLGIELMDNYPAFRLMTYWSMLYMTTPQGKAQVAINQGDSLGNYSGPFYVINRYGQSDALWGWEHTYGLDEGGKFSVEYHGNGWSAPAIIFFEDQSLTPTAPTEEKNPLISIYDKGLVIARDSWENDASMLTFTCGRGYPGCWNHPDDNSFTFHARGESFIVDLGANYKESSEHNVVLIDGKGMDYSGGPTMKEGKLEESTVLDNGNLYLRGDNVTSYKNQGLKASTRQIVYGGGDVPFVLVYDYMRKDNAEHTYNINFFTPSTATIIASPDGDYAKIIGNNTGETCYVIPYSPDETTVSFSAVGSAPCLKTETVATYLRQATLFIMAEEDEEMPLVEWSSEGKTMTVSITRTVSGQKETETYTLGLEELISFTTTEKLYTETETSESETDITVETTEPVFIPTETEESEIITEITTAEDTTEIVTETVTEPAIETTTEAVIETTEEIVETTTEEIVETTAEATIETEQPEDIETTQNQVDNSQTEVITDITETDKNEVNETTEKETEKETESKKPEVTTDFSSTDKPDKKKGCGSSLGITAVIPTVIAGAAIAVFKKKKKYL